MADEDLITTDKLAPAEVGELDLYQKREKIYTRKIEGFFQRIRLYTGWPLLLAYFITPWLQWNDSPAVLFDLPARQFHILSIIFWPQDFPLLAWLLIIAALLLFVVTALFGRIWCGYTCPQTVWTSIYMWMEQYTEGSRNQRIKLDHAPMGIEKTLKKVSKHLLWLGFAFFTGFSFVAYFVPAPQLFTDFVTLDVGLWALSWVVFFTLATYINAGWLREQVCVYMCPYARFQAVMFDKDTLIVSYDPKRGEQRGSRKRGADYRGQGLGDCIDCQLCVQVCPTGIDIRDGLQHECIGCALCIDACDSVMDKMDYPRGLISYTSERELEGDTSHHFLRGRVIGYFTVIALMIGLFVSVLVSRVPLQLDVIRDRQALYHETADGLVENSYTLKLLNMTQEEDTFAIEVVDLPRLQIRGTTEITVQASEVRDIPLRLVIPPQQLDKANNIIHFRAVSLSNPAVRAEAESRFLGPQTRVAR
jgi:cytochrome c oxidase accessory protein FixG